MFESYIKRFIKNSEDVQNPKVREAYGKLTGFTGIILNVFLCLAKIITGLIAGVISIVSDGVNNLSDAASSLVTILGFKLAAKKPDKKHPFGHGRYEYFAGLAVSVIILIVAVELLLDSIKKIAVGATTERLPDALFIVIMAILFVSIFVKLFMFLFYRYVGKKLSSAAIKATSADCVTDCVASSVVMICAFLDRFITGVPLDGIAGIAVSVFIAYTGIRSLIENGEMLLGEAPSPELVSDIRNYVLSFDARIVGVHDVMLHDYGAGRKILVLHAEVPSEGNVMELHDLIDNVEQGLEEKFGCIATIHMDPVETESERVNLLKNVCRDIVKSIDPHFDIHDFRMNEGETHGNLLFDVVITRETSLTPDMIKEIVAQKLSEYDKKYIAVIKVEYPFV